MLPALRVRPVPLLGFIALFAAAVFAAGPPAADRGPGLVDVGLLLATGPAGDCLTKRERQTILERAALAPAPPPVSADTPDLLAFHPQGGVLHRDLAVNNYVDLDPSRRVRDFQCTDWAYDSHSGLDTDLKSFAEQDAGVPVFAALDGTVVDAHDGEPDRNTTASGQPANFVILRHAGSHLTFYWHLKKGSVAVSEGERVVAGQQLGLTGSSGSSTYPHLHFESQVNGAVYEPYAGACRPGPSGWVVQPPAQTATTITDWVYSTASFADYPLPEDGAPRTGSFEVGSKRDISFRPQITGLPVASTYRVRFLGPDGSVALDFPGFFNNEQAYRHAIYYFRFTLDLDAAGTWRTLFDVNGVTVADAPFEALAAGPPPRNRPPSGVTASLLLPGGGSVPICQVAASTIAPDPDYDRVRFRYVWRVNGEVVRESVFASFSDALARSAIVPGDLVTCDVTPTDGTLAAPTASARLRVPDPAAGDANTDGRRDGLDVGLLGSFIVGNATAGVPPFTAPLTKMNLNPSDDLAVDVLDLVLLHGFVSGSIPSLPL